MENIINLPLVPFWMENEKTGKVNIVKSELRKFIQEHLGYYKYNSGSGYDLVKLENGIIRYIKEDELNSEIYSYISFYKLTKVENAFLATSSSLKAIKDSLSYLPVSFTSDSENKSFFYFMNVCVEVKKGKINLLPNTEFKGVIWSQQIIQRNFKINNEESFFEKFLFNISGQNEHRFKSLQTIIGYLLHGYKDPANAKAIILLDENIDAFGTANGGSGKSIFAKAISYLTNLLLQPGRRIDTSNSFVFQQLKPYTKVFYIDDVNQKRM